MNEKTINDVYSALSQVINSTYTSIGDRVLITTNNKIVLFNKYVIFRTSNGYKVASRITFTEVELSSPKIALIWVILENSGRSNDAQCVAALDAKISSMDVEIAIHERIRNKSTNERYSILTNKINFNSARRMTYLAEMKRYTLIAKGIMSSFMEKS